MFFDCFFVLLLYFVITVNCSDIFHVNSKITFYPDRLAEYFGYAVDLSNLGLHVGAPKARSRIKRGIAPGLVFSCPLVLSKTNVTCDPLQENDHDLRSYVPNDFYVHDMWLGATIATVPDDKLLICAPRITVPYQEKHLLANGACLVRSKAKESTFNPLSSKRRQAYRTDGRRLEYGEYSTHLNYFAYGQSGMSVKVTKNDSIIIGAPGVLQWTGAVVEYKFKPKEFFFTQESPSANPYFTTELGPDDYFGYSVESGVFEENKKVLYVAGAPRSKSGYGQVLVFDPPTKESEPLKIKAQLIGPQLGAYFGSSLCTLDIDGDGLSDLLVGAPNFAKNAGQLKYDQGAVIVYMNRKKDSQFTLEPSGIVKGSSESGARFGTAISDIGDVDGDGFRDVAISAPWENGGSGVVYIYKGLKNGLRRQYTQRIQAERAYGFGMSLSKGFDVDRNNCNDLAIGAHDSGTAYVYRSVPTIQVLSSIKVPDAKNLKQNVDKFTALFCVTVPPNWSSPNVEIKLKASVEVDPEGNRANTLGEPDYEVLARSGVDTCDEQIIEVNNQSDLSRPIALNFKLSPVVEMDKFSSFPAKLARLSDDSNLHSSFLIQLLSDCGEDLICTPWLQITIEPLHSPYVPGTDSKVGAKIVVTNLEEPAYSVKLHVSLPHSPKRLPESCSVQDLGMICDLPAPLRRNQSVEWEIEMEYTWDGVEDELVIRAALEDPVYLRNVSDGAKELSIPITPKSNYTLTGKPEPNATISISRKTFDRSGDIIFTHYYEITNRGPSDYHEVVSLVTLPEEVEMVNIPVNSKLKGKRLEFTIGKLLANSTNTYELPLKYNIKDYGEKLEENLKLNVTSQLYLILRNYHGSIGYSTSMKITTTLVLEEKTPIWPLIVGLVAGLLLLAIIILGLYKFGFFSRRKKEELKQLLENNSSQEDSSQTNPLAEDNNSSTHGLIELEED